MYYIAISCNSFFHDCVWLMILFFYSDTSRAKRDSELNGQDYHFISRQEFENDILQRKFVEHGEYEKAYYGTSIKAIQVVVNSGKICVLNLHPLSLKILKSSDLKPFVVFVAPPSLEKLRQKKQRQGETVKVSAFLYILRYWGIDTPQWWCHLFYTLGDIGRKII